MVVLGIVLIGIGFAIVIRPGNLPGDGPDRIGPYKSPRLASSPNRPKKESGTRTLVRLIVGFGVMAVGGLCIALGA
jgi:hypothetical protein